VRRAFLNGVVLASSCTPKTTGDAPPPTELPEARESEQAMARETTLAPPDKGLAGGRSASPAQAKR
jgi:hypothetical protein